MKNDYFIIIFDSILQIQFVSINQIWSLHEICLDDKTYLRVNEEDSLK